MAEKETLSLTRALTTIKTLDEKINSFFDEPRVLISYTVGEKQASPVAGLDKEGLERNIQSTHDKLDYLIKARRKIKAAVVKANATTYIEISGETYSIAEAIELKKTVDIKENVLRAYRQHQRSIQQVVDKNAADIAKRVDDLVKAQTAAGDSSTTEQSMNLYKTTVDNIERQFKFSVLDPVNISKRIEDLNTEISEIKLELDYKLSEVNANTVIEVEI